jgi:hypothetical protein
MNDIKVGSVVSSRSVERLSSTGTVIKHIPSSRKCWQVLWKDGVAEDVYPSQLWLLAHHDAVSTDKKLAVTVVKNHIPGVAEAVRASDLAGQHAGGRGGRAGGRTGHDSGRGARNSGRGARGPGRGPRGARGSGRGGFVLEKVGTVATGLDNALTVGEESPLAPDAAAPVAFPVVAAHAAAVPAVPAAVPAAAPVWGVIPGGFVGPVDISRCKYSEDYAQFVKWGLGNEDVVVDPAGDRLYKHPTRLNWSAVYPCGVEPDGIKPVSKYFQLAFPMQGIRRVAQASYAHAQEAESSATEVMVMKEFGVRNYMRMAGLRLVMALEPRPGASVADYWNVESVHGTIFEPPEFGRRFNISKNEFLTWEKFLRLDYFTGAVDEVSTLLLCRQDANYILYRVLVHFRIFINPSTLSSLTSTSEGE